jgi:type VI secretion system protein ImpK
LKQEHPTACLKGFDLLMGASFTETIHGHTIDLDLTAIGKKSKQQKQESIANLCTDIFLIVIRMRESENLGEPSSLRKLLMHYIELFKKNCNALQIEPAMINDAVYALVALLDETVMSIPGPCRDFWIVNPVQLELFEDNFAGQGFFTRLEKLQTESERMKEVLEIFYLCLCIGFDGKYRLGNAPERETIIDNVARILLKVNKRSVGGLSPHGRRTVSQSVVNNRGTGRVPLWFATGLMALLVGVWWGAMWYLTEQSAQRVIEVIK